MEIVLMNKPKAAFFFSSPQQLMAVPRIQTDLPRQQHS